MDTAIVVRAVLETDNLHYAFLSDKNCVGETITFGTPATGNSPSVRTLLDSLKAKFGAPFPIRGNIEVAGTIIKGSNGRLVFRPTEVLSFELSND